MTLPLSQSYGLFQPTILSMIAIVAVVFSQFINSSFELSITLSTMVCDVPAFDYLGVPTGYRGAALPLVCVEYR